MRNYFIRYDPAADVNYLFLFMLYGIADYDKMKRRYDKIHYNSKKDLAAKLKLAYGDKAFSYSTLNRILSNDNYKAYLAVDKDTITINNNFSNISRQEKEPFIVITSKEADFLVQQNDKLLATYYCYLKYYCGLAAKAGFKQDATAKQFLLSVGLSADNHNNLSRISSYNTLLSNEGFIKIDKYRDENGNERNIYTMP